MTERALSAQYDVAVLGGGPAGLAAALAADSAGARVLLCEREARLGGILKQCIHDGFGLVRFGEKLAGCEYATRFIRRVPDSGVEVSLSSFATKVERGDGGVNLTLCTAEGMRHVAAKTLVLATGCRERTARQVSIHGTRPAGIFTAGAAQYFVNVMGLMPTRRCVILGSGDIGLIMARRLTLEGATVEGVYEVKPTPGGLSRNISQCLNDFGIPLHCSHTVTRVFGRERVEAVEVARVDMNMRPIAGTERRIECDALILSVGLIPENELAESMGVPLDRATKGAVCDQNMQTLLDGVFACGNALHVNDLVDYVSESGECAGLAAARMALSGRTERALAALTADGNFLCAVPQRVDISRALDHVVLFFRAREERARTRISLSADGREVFSKVYRSLRPPEMERLELDLSAAGLTANSALNLTMEEA